MGNCQAAEAATVVIQHPGGRIERIYWSLSASQVMASNPGHYVAVIITSQPAPNSGRTGAAAAPVKHLKLLRPDDTLHIGQVYRLVSFEEVLREFSSKKHVRLSRLLIANKEKRQIRSSGDGGGRTSSPATEAAAAEAAEGGEQSVAAAPAAPYRQGQWKPALQSISEVIGS